MTNNMKHHTTPGNLEQVKKLMLQMAVQGKLTAQWHSNVKTRFIVSQESAKSPGHSACAFLEKVKTDKEQLIK